jgi:hypothetical protein
MRNKEDYEVADTCFLRELGRVCILFALLGIGERRVKR